MKKAATHRIKFTGDETLKITKHAQERIQQRGFQKGFIDLVLEYGTPQEKNGTITEYRIYEKQRDSIVSEMKKLISMVENCSQKAVMLTDRSNVVTTICGITN